MKITLEISEENEGTAYPWWMIVDPHQNFKTNDEGLYNVAGMITGPFFSRAEAETVLRQQRHHFGVNAKVFCASGHNTVAYGDAFREVPGLEGFGHDAGLDKARTERD